jgi:hypothetical protein
MEKRIVVTRKQRNAISRIHILDTVKTAKSTVMQGKLN